MQTLLQTLMQTLMQVEGSAAEDLLKAGRCCFQQWYLSQVQAYGLGALADLGWLMQCTLSCICVRRRGNVYGEGVTGRRDSGGKRFRRPLPATPFRLSFSKQGFSTTREGSVRSGALTDEGVH